MEHGPLRLQGAGELQRMAGADVAALALGPLQGGDQRRRLDLAFGQSLRNRAAVGDELRLPGDAVLAVRQLDPPRVRDEGDVLFDVKDEVPGRAVIAAQAARDPLARLHGVLALVVDFVANSAGIGYATGHPRHRGWAQERHVLGPARNGKEICAEHQVVEIRLQSTVEQGREQDIALPLAASPQCFVHLDIEQQVVGSHIAPQAAHVPEVRAVLECLAEDRLEAFVKFVVRPVGQGLVARGVRSQTRVPARPARGRARCAAPARGRAARTSRRCRKVGSLR